jgi:simple sugar transport system permease protein
MARTERANLLPEDTPAAKPDAPEVLVTALALDEVTPMKRRLADSQPTTFSGKLKENIYFMRGRGALEISIIYAIIFLVFSVMYASDTAGFPFLSKNNISGVLTQNIPVLAILAIGAGLLMIAGEYDLSLGAAIGLAAIVFIHVANSAPWWLAFLAAVGTSMGVSLVNGLIVILTKIPSFIATLGMSFFWTGASIYVNGTEPAVLFTDGHDTAVSVLVGPHGYFRSQLVWLIVIGVVAWFLLHRHRFGNKLYAVGGNAAAAKAVSIKPNLIKLQAFVLMGALTGIAAVLIAARTADMQPGTTEDYTLLAIAAAVVGGCALLGGRGTIFGMVIGAALILTVENGLLLGQTPGFYVQLFLGLSIVAATIFNKFMEGKAT